jgi:hypothetical protein
MMLRLRSAVSSTALTCTTTTLYFRFRLPPAPLISRPCHYSAV